MNLDRNLEQNAELQELPGVDLKKAQRKQWRERKQKSRAAQAVANSSWIFGLIIGTDTIYFDGQFAPIGSGETVATLHGQKRIENLAHSERLVWFRLTADGRAVDIEQ